MLYVDEVMTLDRLVQGVNAASGPDRRLDYELFRAFAEKDAANYWDPKVGHFYTSSVDAALSLVARVLPGWWVTSGLCSLSGHASIGPDYNGPDGERLKAEFPPERFDHGGFDADLKPGDGPHRQCLAILACLLSAKLAMLTEAENA
jgi:hypothetical protein